MKTKLFIWSLLMLLLVACSSQIPQSINQDSFTLELSELKLSLMQGETARLTLKIVRSKGFTQDVTLSVEKLPESLSVSFVTNPVRAQTVLVFEVSDNARPITDTLLIKAEAAGLESQAKLELSIVENKEAIKTIQIEGYLESRQVRQGAGVITLNVTGINLADIRLARLGSVDGKILAKDKNSARLEFRILPGAAPGDKALSLISNSETFVKEAAATITEITASPEGNDEMGLGTPDLPFRSLSKAVRVATPASGDRIKLLNGTYNAAQGEVFPINISGLTVEGSSKENTILDGRGTTGVNGLFVDGFETDISFLTLMRFSEGAGIYLKGGETTIRHITAKDIFGDGRDDEGDGIALNETATAIVSEVAIQNTDDGISASDGSSLTLSNYLATAVRDDGLDIGLDATAIMSDISIQASQNNGIQIAGSSVVTITNARISESQEVALELGGQASVKVLGGELINNGLEKANATIEIFETSTVVIDQLTVKNNQGEGILLRDTASLSLRKVTISNNGAEGIRVEDSPGLIDLGTTFSAGNNIVMDNANWQLLDNRVANQTVVITSIGNDFEIPLTGLQTGISLQEPIWSITSEGNQVDFGQ